MSCCGEPKNKADNEQGNRPISQFNHAFVNQQPSPIQDLTAKPSYQGQPLPSPPPVHLAQNGYYPPQQQGWDGRPSSPPPMSMIHGRTSSPRPPSMSNGMNGHNPSYSMNSSMRQSISYGMNGSPFQSSSLSPGSPPPMSTSPVGRSEPSSPPIDEGKMSVSIDFGTSLPCF